MDEGSLNVSDAEVVKTHCAELFAQRDYVMEPDVVNTLLAYFQAGGEPGMVVDSLSSTYEGLSQYSNLLGCWLSELEADRSQIASTSSTSPLTSPLPAPESMKSRLESCTAVRECFESTITRMIAGVFSPDCADKIFEVVDGNEGLDWLPMLIAHKPWRVLIYELVESYPNCLMLNFAVKLISDAGFQHEISNVSTAAQQLDIFSRVFLSSVEQMLAGCMSGGGEKTAGYQKAFEELRRVACHSEQTYLYTQALFQAAADQDVPGKDKAISVHIAQSLRIALAKRKGRETQETSPVSLALLQSDNDQIPTNVTQAMLTMLIKRALNPADIGQLYQEATQAYFEPFPPPVELIRDPVFVEMLVDAIFSRLTPRINAEHRPKYIYLLAYASSVAESRRNGIRVQSKAELDPTKEHLEQLTTILYSPDDLLLSLNELLRLLKTPVLAVGLLNHVNTLLLRDDYLGEPQPVHLTLIDQITTHHTNLHSRVFEALCQLIERQNSRSEVAEIVMARQKSLIDRFCHLLFSGYVTPVVECVMSMYQKGRLDSSLLRYFILETLEMIEPPYSKEFVKCFLPLMLDPGVFDQINKNQLAKAFIENASRAAQLQRQ